MKGTLAAHSGGTACLAPGGGDHPAWEQARGHRRRLARRRLGSTCRCGHACVGTGLWVRRG